MTKLELKAPLSGLLMPIEQVPDPVFAAKLLGDGIALDPVSNALLAPCEGHVIHIHDAHHSLTIATPDGVEILLHIGLDTVSLGGEGFLPHVQKGDFVLTGQMLIEFNPDYVAQYAPSLLTLIVITNSETVAGFGKASGEATAGQTVIMNLDLNGQMPQVKGTPVSGLSISSPPISFPNRLGLHARPAAVLAELARKFNARVRLCKGDLAADARSVVGIMNLNVEFSDPVSLVAVGPDAQEAIDALAPALENGLGESGGQAVLVPASVAQTAINAPAPRRRSAEANVILGAAASPGLAVGNVYQFRRREIVVDEAAVGDAVAERATLDRAIGRAELDLQALQVSLRRESKPGKAAVYAAHQEMLHDPALLDMAQEVIEDGFSAAYAWQTAIAAQSSRLEGLNSDLLAARAGDLRDAGRRVFAHLPGVHEEEPPDLPANTILIAEELTFSDVAALNRDRVAGFATTLGGAASHAAILARALDLPAIAGIEARALDLPNGTPLILDATRARLQLNPKPEEIAYMVGMLRKRRQKRKADLEAAHYPAVTEDGRRLEITADIGSEEAAEAAVLLGAEGVGMLRTEFLFLDRFSAPREDEQAQVYAAVAGVMGRKKPTIIRTLNTGGDQPLPYLPVPRQQNPLYGERGIRIGLDHPYLLRTQIRAILRASRAGGNIHILLPMVATLDDWRMARAVIEEEAANLGVNPVPVGIMAAIPAVAMMAEQFAREVDFFSISSSDLAQYTLAMDRDHPRFAPQVDGLNPAVLRLIAQTIEGAEKYGRWVSVTGGMAADPQAAPILMGLGVHRLSMAAPAIPMIKALVRALSFAEAQQTAQQALTLESAAEVRALYPLEDYEL